jgi:REP-associated tyrosine transposase
MGRFARVVVVDVPHHVTQRGNARQLILTSDGDRVTYLALLRQYSEVHGLGVLGYCLMSNHVHLIAVPHAPDAMARALKQAHGRYATYWNARQSSSGHVWQGRFYSCPLDDTHLWEALRYVELNPVRAKMVATAEQWRWSSAAAHCGRADADAMLQMERWARRWTVTEWERFLAEGASESEAGALRQCTHTGRPLGGIEFVAELERTMLRPLAPHKGGRPKKAAADERQMSVSFVA